MKKYVVITIPFDTWKNILVNNDKFICITNSDVKKYNNSNYKLMPIWVDDYIKYNHLEYNIFKNNLENIDIFENKSKFGKYMIKYFPDNIPRTYYYNFDNESYNNYNIPVSKKYIVKPNKSYAGIGIKIIKHSEPNEFRIKYIMNNKLVSKNINNIKDHVIQEYIDHVEYYTGHFIVLNGVIHDKIYFCSNDKNVDEIKKGQCTNYQIIEKLKIDDSIFDKIYIDLSFSGFTSIDFIINNNKIIIFEINPRLGGSLIHDEKYFNIFLEKLNMILT
jgi:carbamoylphosphate synthase large subunit